MPAAASPIASIAVAAISLTPCKKMDEIAKLCIYEAAPLTASLFDGGLACRDRRGRHYRPPHFDLSDAGNLKLSISDRTGRVKKQRPRCGASTEAMFGFGATG